MFWCRFSEKIDLGLKIYVKISNFALNVNFFHFPKKLGNIRYTLYILFLLYVLYVTSSINCTLQLLLGRGYGFPQPFLQKVLKTMHLFSKYHSFELEFYFPMFWLFARLISDQSIHVCKHESQANMKAKHTSIQKSYFCRPNVYFQWERLRCWTKF